MATPEWHWLIEKKINKRNIQLAGWGEALVGGGQLSSLWSSDGQPARLRPSGEG
jgi:hypothetical protein